MLNLITHDLTNAATGGAIHEIQMARPPVNALNLAMLQALRKALQNSIDQGARGIVLSGAPGLFSAGADVPSLLQIDRAGVREFWTEFFAVCAALARSPVPVVASITGHSPAGGAVLALFCDYRVMAEGPFKIGLNEVRVGLVVPDNIQMALRRIVGAYRAERLMVSGAMITADEALACGFVDETTNVDQVTTRSLFWLNELLTLPSEAMLATRAIARADLAAAYADPDRLPLESFLDGFFHPQTQAVLKDLVARLKKKG
jgi:3,2-trans-enoyl-CoA isomerase